MKRNALCQACGQTFLSPGLAGPVRRFCLACRPETCTCGQPKTSRSELCVNCEALTRSEYSETHARCGQCVQWLPLAAFYARSDPRFTRPVRSHCKQCEIRSVQERRKLDREKYVARNAVTVAIRSRRLVPRACEDCGEPHGVQAHHDDYGRPLEVHWLCVRCHNRTHSRDSAAA
jgi:hypothetical protein